VAACVLAAAVPLLQGCIAAMVAAQAVPVAITGTTMAATEHRSPFITHAPAAARPKQDELARVDEYIRGAECGDARSQYLFADVLGNRFNADLDYVEVYMWYRLAEMRRYEPATERLAELEPFMTEADITAGRQRASEWEPGGADCEANA
jgi:hypothetical protein